MDKDILKQFQQLPGVGKSIAVDLYELGFRSNSELMNENPEELYERFCRLKGMHIDRCMLYVLRCIVYYVSNKKHDPALLLWWNWKDDGGKKIAAVQKREKNYNRKSLKK
ncbi:MAG: helix-hairpin-helix domain-containing protein [Bacteroidota bacterium]